MRLFISWSGTTSKAIAIALRDWLPIVLHSVEPWMSEADIHAGQQWWKTLNSELERTDFGIVCLTPDNLESPWLHYEAGALSKSIEESRLIPFLYDLEPTELRGPFSAFQAKRTSKEGTRELVLSIQDRAGSRKSSNAVERVFDAFWPELHAILANLPREPKEKLQDTDSEMTEISATVPALDRRQAESQGRSQSRDGSRPAAEKLVRALSLEAREQGVRIFDIQDLGSPSVRVVFYDEPEGSFLLKLTRLAENFGFQLIAETKQS